MTSTANDPRYPIGRFEPRPFSQEELTARLDAIRLLPEELERAIENLDEAQMETPYREGGWTLRQVVHHVADSHLNAFCRIKLTLTEENPIIRPYDEVAWAETADYKLVPVNVSLTLLHALHRRMWALLSSVEGVQWERTYIHPATNKSATLWQLLGIYAWHGRHHTAHILRLREEKGW